MFKLKLNFTETWHTNATGKSRKLTDGMKQNYWQNTGERREEYTNISFFQSERVGACCVPNHGARINTDNCLLLYKTTCIANVLHVYFIGKIY